MTTDIRDMDKSDKGSDCDADDENNALDLTTSPLKGHR